MGVHTSNMRIQLLMGTLVMAVLFAFSADAANIVDAVVPDTIVPELGDVAEPESAFMDPKKEDRYSIGKAVLVDREDKDDDNDDFLATSSRLQKGGGSSGGRSGPGGNSRNAPSGGCMNGCARSAASA